MRLMQTNGCAMSIESMDVTYVINCFVVFLYLKILSKLNS